MTKEADIHNYSSNVKTSETEYEAMQSCTIDLLIGGRGFLLQVPIDDVGNFDTELIDG